jgi:hypothetical protein
MDNLRSDLVHPEQIPADRELLVVCIAGAISKHMTVSLYPKEVLAAAEYIVDRYTTPANKPWSDLSNDYTEVLIDDLAEWSTYVEVDSAPRTLKDHIRQVLTTHKEQS